MKTNYDYLKELLADHDEALEFLDGLQKDHDEETDELKLKIINASDRISELEDEQQEDEDNGLISVNLGLDTLHYRLEKGNLLIQSKLESFLKFANTVKHTETLMQ